MTFPVGEAGLILASLFRVEVVERAGAKVIIDAESAHFLAGSTIDYVDDLAGSGFRIQNPNAARSCGCGTSFEPADAEAETHQH